MTNSTNKIDLYPGQRKTCRAVATIVKGNGKIRVNNIPAEVIEPEIAKELILTPAHLIGDLRDRVDVSVRVNGGGFMGQAFASAVANAWPMNPPFTRTLTSTLSLKS